MQVFSENLNRLITGKKVKRIKVMARSIKGTTVRELKKCAEGQTIRKVFRDGKEIILHFDNENNVALHMMLRGKLQMTGDGKQPKYTIVLFDFTDGTALSLTDPLGKARIRLNPEAEAPDVLSPGVTVAFLREALDRKTAIKNVLTDQEVMRGIGNAYADEILWKAGISPFSIASKIPPTAVRRLHRAIKSVMAWATREIRKASPGIIGGEVREFLRIHNAGKKKSPSGANIRSRLMGSRKTYHTNEQELYK